MSSEDFTVKEDLVFSAIGPLFQNRYTDTSHATPPASAKRTSPPEC